MKQVWANRPTWSWTASTTAGAAWPTLTTAIPEPEVDERVAVDVDQDRPVAALDVERERPS